MNGATLNWTALGARAVLAALVLALLGALLAGSAPEWAWVHGQLQQLRQVAESQPVQAALLFLALRFLFSVVSVPGSGVLTVAGGVMFGFWAGLALVLVAVSTGALVIFLLTRYALHDAVRRRFPEALRRVDRHCADHGPSALFLLRIAEPFPTFLINALFALTRMPARTYFWVSLLGMFPGVAILTNAGAQLEAVHTPAELMSTGMIASLVALGAIPLLSSLAAARLRADRRRGGD